MPTTPERPPSVPNSPYPPRPPVVDPDRLTITRPVSSRALDDDSPVSR